LRGDRYLGIYLNDHLAGSAVGVELARRVRRGNEEEPSFGEPLRRLCGELEEDQDTLLLAIERLGFSPSRVKQLGGRLLERLGRLKLNGQLRGYSPLSRVLELEGLQIGISGKLDLWRTLGEHPAGKRAGLDVEHLKARAEAQRAAVEELHRLAVGALAAADA